MVIGFHGGIGENRVALTLNHKADLRILRAEAQNALAPFLAEAEEVLRRKHAEDNQAGITRRHVNAIPEVRNLVIESFEAVRARITSS